MAMADDAPAPTTAAITKVLQVPEGTAVPTATFTFDVTLVSVDGETATEPAIGPIDITIDGNATPAGTQDGVTTYFAESGDILSGITFPHAGIYVYTVTEKSATNPTIDGDAYQSLTYSDASYTMTVYVVNDEDALEVNAAFVTSEGDKIDATPGTGDDHPYSEMAFTNTYVHTNGPEDSENPNPATESTLTISKNVAGNLASKEQQYNFSVTLSASKLATDVPEYYRAYLVDATGVIDPSNNCAASLLGQDTGNDQYTFIKVSTSDATEFTLKHGQKLVFVDTPTGTSYEVSEITPTGYEPSLVVTTDAIVTGSIDVKAGETLASGQQLVGESTNTAAFTNTRNLMTPTGISASAAPFVGFVGLVIIGLAAYVLVKSRMRVNG